MTEKIKILIIDDDATEALLLANFLSTNNYHITIVPTIFKEAIMAIERHLPDIIILSLSHAREDIVGLEIATHIHHTYSIPVLLQVEFHLKEDLQQYIDTLPYSCILKPKENNFDQILNTIKFSEPHIVGKLCKYKAFQWRVTTLEIDSNGEPISKKGMIHYYENKSINLCDILYFRSGNAHIKNSTLIRLKGDKNNYYATKETITYFLSILPSKLFAQIHDSNIVSIDKITGYHLLSEFYIDGISIPIGKSYIAVAKEIIANI